MTHTTSGVLESRKAGPIRLWPRVWQDKQLHKHENMHIQQGSSKEPESDGDTDLPTLLTGRPNRHQTVQQHLTYSLTIQRVHSPCQQLHSQSIYMKTERAPLERHHSPNARRTYTLPITYFSFATVSNLCLLHSLTYAVCWLGTISRQLCSATQMPTR